MKNFFALCMMLSLWGHAATAQAPDTSEFWEFGSWRVFVKGFDTGEDWRVSCTALTGSDGDPVATLEISNGDVGPPDFFPALKIREHAIRGYDARMKTGQTAYVWFDNEDVYDGETHSFFDEYGFNQAQMEFAQSQSEWLIEAMRKNGQMDVVLDGEVFHSFWLDGFTASYLKMMEACGHL
jgi:hypothetical protein